MAAIQFIAFMISTLLSMLVVGPILIVPRLLEKGFSGFRLRVVRE